MVSQSKIEDLQAMRVGVEPWGGGGWPTTVATSP